MKRAGRKVLVLAAVAGLAVAAAAAQAHPSGMRGMESHAQGKGSERHAAMQAQMAQHMAQRGGGQGQAAHGAMAQGGCPMASAQAGTQEHKH